MVCRLSHYLNQCWRCERWFCQLVHQGQTPLKFSQNNQQKALKMSSAKYLPFYPGLMFYDIDLVTFSAWTHWGRVTDNGLFGAKPLLEPALAYFHFQPQDKLQSSLVQNTTVSIKRMRLKMSSVKCQPFCRGPNGLIARQWPYIRWLRGPFYGFTLIPAWICKYIPSKVSYEMTSTAALSKFGNG